MISDNDMIVRDMIETRIKGDVLIIKYKADQLYFTNTKVLFEYLRILSGSYEIVVMDMTSVKNMDSTGCGCLLRFNRHLEGKGGQLNIICNNPIFMLLSRISMNRLIPIYQSYEELDFDISED